jgi:hypothetical protein
LEKKVFILSVSHTRSWIRSLIFCTTEHYILEIVSLKVETPNPIAENFWLYGMKEKEHVLWAAPFFSLAAVEARKNEAVERYRRFVREGKVQSSPWLLLLNRVYLGSEAFVEKVQAHIDRGQEFSEIPASQRRLVPRSLECYAA